MQVSRRQFFKICAGGMAGTTAAALGFAPGVALAETRQYKLLRTRETRNTCTYCSVGCGLLMYSLGDGAKNAKASIFHIEGGRFGVERIDSHQVLQFGKRRDHFVFVRE